MIVSGVEELVDLVLMERCDRPIAIERAVRRFTSVPVQQAHKMAETESLPQELITQLPRQQAEAIKLELEAVGAILELRPAGAPGAPTDLR